MPETTKASKSVVIDGTDCAMGRLATLVAKRLLEGQTIDLVNCDRVVIVGNHKAIKARYKFKVEVGNERKGPFHPRMPHLIMKRTVRGMLPYQQDRGRQALKRLKCHIAVPPQLANAEVEAGPDNIKKANRPGMTLLEVSRYLGKNIEVPA